MRGMGIQFSLYCWQYYNQNKQVEIGARINNISLMFDININYIYNVTSVHRLHSYNTTRIFAHVFAKGIQDKYGTDSFETPISHTRVQYRNLHQYHIYT